MYDVRGKVVLVTGAARGIGAEAARQLSARGARVALVGLEPEELEARAAELGPEAAAFYADVTDVDALDEAVAGTVERFGGIDVVIANAGVSAFAPVIAIRPEDFERTIEINLLGVWRTVRATLPHVIERRGYVLPIASLAAVIHSPMMSAYAATKAGVEAFCDCLRSEVAHTGTAVGCAYFGFIETDLVREGMAHPATEKMRAQGPRFMATPIPVERAGAAIVRGIERRSRVVVAPGWVRAALVGRGIFQPVVEWGLRRRPETADAVRIAADVAGSEATPGATLPSRAER